MPVAFPGLDYLIKAKLPEFDDDNVNSKVDMAISRYRNRHSSLEDRRQAVCLLVDVFEFLREQLKGVLSSRDEDDLFNIANNYGLRHHNNKQRTDFDKKVWYDWMFCFYLSNIHLALRLLKRKKQEPKL